MAQSPSSSSVLSSDGSGDDELDQGGSSPVGLPDIPPKSSFRREEGPFPSYSGGIKVPAIADESQTNPTDDLSQPISQGRNAPELDTWFSARSLCLFVYINRFIGPHFAEISHS